MADLAGEKIAYLGYCGPIDSAGVTRIAQNLSGAVDVTPVSHPAITRVLG